MIPSLSLRVSFRLLSSLILVLVSLASLAVGQSAPVSINANTTSPDVLTYHYDVARTGWYRAEGILKPSNVNSSTFGKIGFFAVDGKVDAQPLYLSAVIINATRHNVVYAVTEHDSAYAFDADTGSQLWKISVLQGGESTSDPHGCGQISPKSE